MAWDKAGAALRVGSMVPGPPTILLCEGTENVMKQCTLPKCNEK